MIDIKSYDYYNKIAFEYDSQYKEPYWDLYHEITKRLIKDIINNEKNNVLDLGSGTGFWAEFFLHLEHNVTIAEPSKNMIEICKEKLKEFSNVNYFNCFAENLPFENDSFDIVNAQGDVLSYVESFDKSMKEIKRVLKNNGILIASVDSFYSFAADFISNGEFLDFEEMIKRGFLPIGSESGVFNSHPFSVDEIYGVAEKYNFKLIDIAGKMVLGPYENAIIKRNFEKICDYEYSYCRNKGFIGRSEHIHFVLKKFS